MSFPTDDLGPLLVPPPSGKGLRYGQGRVLTWNAETFENQVEWLGITLTNLPVMAGVDALTFQANDIVGLLGWQPGGGAGSWWILGKIIIPGSTAAELAIEFLRSRVAEQITREVFAAGMLSADVDLIQPSTSATYGDLATVGPEISDVNISESGKMLVFTSARIILSVVDGTVSSSAAGFASFEISGATSVAANDRDAGFRSLNFSTHNGANPHNINEAVVSTKMSLVTGLNQGTHTVTMKYRRTTSGTPTVSFGVRTIVVVAL